MDAVAAGGVSGALGADAAFHYNQYNFMMDRYWKIRWEIQIQRFKMTQASLWREDVRDLISLTEYKMHVYLLVNVLMIGKTLVMSYQGHLPERTPIWLISGAVLARWGAFMFLWLSLWMAMHAAVAAQAYEVRLLTQMVRLPIPSWQEMEAQRTDLSDFEKLELKQMFRIPFLMGSQEDLVNGTSSGRGAKDSAKQEVAAAGDSFRSLSSTTLASQLESEKNFAATDVTSNAGSWASSWRALGRVGGSSVGGGSGVLSSERSDGGSSGDVPDHMDPWGFEGTGEKIEELGCKVGSNVSQLRHIKMTRQAMIHWQAYDAFARISMGIGVSHMLLGITYFVLGYLHFEVGCRTVATYGVFLLTLVRVILLRLDMSLSTTQLFLLQLLLVLGPLSSTIAAFCWTNRRQMPHTTQALVAVSFLSHGTFVAAISNLARVDRKSGDGVVLPASFSSVLYLDVFGWMARKRGSHPSKRAPPGFVGTGGLTAGGAAGPASALLLPSIGRSDSRSSLDSSFEEHWGREVISERGFPTASPTAQPPRIVSLASLSPTSLRSIGGEGGSGAKNADGRSTSSGDQEPRRPRLRTEYRPDGKPVVQRPEDSNPPGFIHDLRDLPGAPRLDMMNPGESYDTHFFDAESWLRHDKATGGPPLVTGHGGENPRVLPSNIFVFCMRALSIAWILAGLYHAIAVVSGKRIEELGNQKHRHMHFAASLLGLSGTLRDPDFISFEQLTVSWPHAEFEPRTLSCDASGHHFVTSDGLFLFAAQLPQGGGGGGSSVTSAMQSAANNVSEPKRALRPPSPPVEPLRLEFSEVRCGQLEGESLQDAAVACRNGDTCEALVLHRRGGRAAACALPATAAAAAAAASPATLAQGQQQRQQGEDGEEAAAAGNFTSSIPDAWLERVRLHRAAASEGELAKRHGRMEKAVTIATSLADCRGCSLDDRWRARTLLGTSRGRVVRLRHRSNHLGQQLLPAGVISDSLLGSVELASEEASAGSIRPLDAHHLGVLQPEGRGITVLDTASSGSDSQVAGRLDLPSFSPPAAGFCVGGGWLHFLGSGRDPAIFRLRLPANLAAVHKLPSLDASHAPG